jgi:hypothetical protein
MLVASGFFLVSGFVSGLLVLFSATLLLFPELSPLNFLFVFTLPLVLAYVLGQTCETLFLKPSGLSLSLGFCAFAGYQLLLHFENLITLVFLGKDTALSAAPALISLWVYSFAPILLVLALTELVSSWVMPEAKSEDSYFLERTFTCSRALVFTLFISLVFIFARSTVPFEELFWL